MILWLLACAPDLSGELDPGDTAGRPTAMTTTDGVVVHTVHAESSEVATDLDVDGDTAPDLSFSRFTIRLQDGVEATWADGVLGDVDAPTDGWRVDGPDADADGVDDLVFVDWYDYDESTHLLSPKPRVWFVRTPASVTALSIASYYDAFGTPAVYTLDTLTLE